MDEYPSSLICSPRTFSSANQGLESANDISWSSRIVGCLGLFTELVLVQLAESSLREIVVAGGVNGSVNYPPIASDVLPQGELMFVSDQPT